MAWPSSERLVQCVFIVVCLCAAAAPFVATDTDRGPDESHFPGWPEQFEGRVLSEVGLTEREAGFTEESAGKVARFTDGQRSIIVRWLDAAVPPYRFHSASDCMRAAGHRVAALPLYEDRDGRLWGSFSAATSDGTALIVRERIWDLTGNSWADISAWFWAATRSQTRGPWWSMAVAERDRP